MPQSHPQATHASTLTIGTHYPAHGGTLGAILCTPDGAVYGLIVADAAHEIVAGAWGEYGLDVPGAKGIDGAANTRAMAAAHSPIATAVQALAIDGHTDWYIPSRIESAALFEGVRDLFDHDDWYWTSSQYSRHGAFIQGFEYGSAYGGGKDNEYRVRPVRKIQLGPFTPSTLVAAGDSAQIFAPGEQQAVAEAVA